MKRKQIIMREPGEKRVKVDFTKKGEEVEVLGLVLGEDKGEYVLDVVADHKAGDTKGKVEVRAIAKGGAVVRLSGMIKIRKGAGRVEDFLELRALVLDEKSRAYAEPKLEIEADDVVASHAASVSQVDPEQVYYLRSRGIEEERAEELLVEGFLAEMKGKMKKIGEGSDKI